MRPFFGRSKMSRVLSARARARAPGPRVALGPPALLTIGDYDQRLFARAQLSKNIFSLWGRSFISVSISYCFNWSLLLFKDRTKFKLRAREKSLSVVSYLKKGRRPQCYTRAGRARARALSTRDILGTSRKHRLSNKSATASSPRIRPYSV